MSVTQKDVFNIPVEVVPATAAYQVPFEITEKVIAEGDLSKLSPPERLTYYNAVCKSVGLNPLTRPLEYIRLQGKLTLYARRDAADQLRKINGVSLEIIDKRVEDGVMIVHVRARDKHGRVDEDLGVVPIAGLKGDALANAMLKSITKGKRRVTLSICGLGFLDETEVETIPGAQPERPVQPEPVSVIPILTLEQKAEAVAALREAISTSDDLEGLRDATRAALNFAKTHNDKALHEDFKSQSAGVSLLIKERQNSQAGYETLLNRAKEQDETTS